MAKSTSYSDGLGLSGSRSDLGLMPPDLMTELNRRGWSLDDHMRLEALENAWWRRTAMAVRR